MSATGEREDKPVVKIQHPAPKLDTLQLESGDHVLYDVDNPDAWYQIDEENIWTMDGGWR